MMIEAFVAHATSFVKFGSDVALLIAECIRMHEDALTLKEACRYISATDAESITQSWKVRVHICAATPILEMRG